MVDVGQGHARHRPSGQRLIFLMLDRRSAVLDDFIESRRVHVQRDEGRVVVTLKRAVADLWRMLLVLLVILIRYRPGRKIDWAEASVLLGVFLVFTVWQAFYTETLELSPQLFVLSKKLWGIGTTNSFDLNRIRNFRYNKTRGRYSIPAILFDHDLDLGISWGFAGPLNRVEAVNLIKAIEAYRAAKVPT